VDGEAVSIASWGETAELSARRAALYVADAEGLLPIGYALMNESVGR